MSPAENSKPPSGGTIRWINHIRDAAHSESNMGITSLFFDRYWSSKRATGWRRPIGCLKSQVIFRKRATNYRAILRKMTSKDRASYGSLPPCMWIRELCGGDQSWEEIWNDGSFLFGGWIDGCQSYGKVVLLLYLTVTLFIPMPLPDRFVFILISPPPSPNPILRTRLQLDLRNKKIK